MDFTRQQKLSLLLWMSCLLGLGVYIQSKFFLNWDVGFIFYATKRLLAGGTYLKDFFDFNPPLIFYFTIPVVFLNKFVTIYTAFIIYLYTVGTISLSLTYYFAKKIFKEKIYVVVLLSLITLSFFILPLYDFGQREYVLMLMSWPYILLVGARLENTSIPKWLASFVGIFSGIGFLIKPFFLFMPLVIEIYYAFIKRNLMSFLRIEVIAFASLSLLYLSSIFLFYPDFINVVLPFAFRLKYLSLSDDWYILLKNPFWLYAMMTFLFCFASLADNPYRKILGLLVTIAAGAGVLYLVQRTNWSYHILPFFTYTLIISLFIFFQNVIAPSPTKVNIAIMLAIILLIFDKLFIFAPSIVLFTKLYPIQALSFLAAILLLIILFAKESIAKKMKAMITLLLFIVICIFITTMSERTNWEVIVIGLCLLATFNLTIRQFNHRNYYTIIALVGIGLLWFPCFSYDYNFVGTLNFKRDRVSRMTKYINLHAEGEPTYFLHSDITFAFPAILNAENIVYASRFPHMWMFSGIVKKSIMPHKSIAYKEYLDDSAFIRQMIAQDFLRYKPNLVFVDIRKQKDIYLYKQKYFFSHPKYQRLNFDYIQFLNANETFKNIWQHYTYFDTLVDLQYKQKIAVFKKIKPY